MRKITFHRWYKQEHNMNTSITFFVFANIFILKIILIISLVQTDHN